MSITGEHQWHSCQIRGKFRSVKLHLDLKMLQQALQAGLRVFMQHSLNLIPTHKTSNICREKQIEGGRVLISRLGGSVIVRWTNPSSVPSSAEPVLLSHNRRLFSFVRFQTVHLFFSLEWQERRREPEEAVVDANKTAWVEKLHPSSEREWRR